jgi:transposase-like protein
MAFEPLSTLGADEAGCDPRGPDLGILAFPGHGVMKPEQKEIDRLRRELARMKAERDILKKAAAYFAKDSI